jgi:hypothetical protein
MLGCAAKNGTVPAPAPPPLTISQISVTLAQAVASADKAMIAARNDGTMSPQDCLTGQHVTTIINKINRKFAAELTTDDPWPVQQTVIVQIIKDSALEQAAAHLPPLARSLLGAAIVAFNQISTAAGGPTI